MSVTDSKMVKPNSRSNCQFDKWNKLPACESRLIADWKWFNARSISREKCEEARLGTRNLYQNDTRSFKDRNSCFLE